MKRADLVKRLRKLQAEAYGALPNAERVAQKCLDKYPSGRTRRPEDESHSRTCYEHGAMQATTRFLASDIDELIEDLGPKAVR